MLIPLTNSLYVPAKLADHENVIVDIGTGYYVQKVRASWLYTCSIPINSLVDSCRRIKILSVQSGFAATELGVFAGHHNQKAG